MNILLTGGSGAVGQKVLEKLCEETQADITVFDLKTKKTTRFYKPYRKRTHLHYGDISQADQLAAVCKDVDFVIHLAAIIPPLADQKPDLAHRVNVVGTQNLIRALEKQSKKAFLLYASSVSIYGDRLENPMIHVGDPLLPSMGDEYARTKIQAERCVIDSQLDWSIFRLSAIMGTNNHAMSGLMFHMPLSTPMEITTPADTARAFVHALEKKDRLSRQIFNLGGGEHCRIDYQDFLSRSFRILGLGNADFPKRSFAEKNFHCGYYADGDELEKILQFRKDTMHSYFMALEKDVRASRKFFTALLSKPIKNHLQRQSEPYRAFRESDPELMQRFFH